jgi:hypothetical protein
MFETIFNIVTPLTVGAVAVLVVGYVLGWLDGREQLRRALEETKNYPRIRITSMPATHSVADQERSPIKFPIKGERS